ncbi:hypothetical protein AB0E01_43020 [Nocardia vinacea]|uniref:hypothetical protein n=1 Tax=Nocardia vinacea TaxID=96468 RepID=UPI0033D303BB
MKHSPMWCSGWIGDLTGPHASPGLDELLTSAGFAKVTWEQVMREMRNTRRGVGIAVQNYDEQRAALHEMFIARASVIVDDGHITGGAGVSIATNSDRAPSR